MTVVVAVFAAAALPSASFADGVAALFVALAVAFCAGLLYSRTRR